MKLLSNEQRKKLHGRKQRMLEQRAILDSVLRRGMTEKVIFGRLERECKRESYGYSARSTCLGQKQEQHGPEEEAHRPVPGRAKRPAHSRSAPRRAKKPAHHAEKSKRAEWSEREQGLQVM